MRRTSVTACTRTLRPNAAWGSTALNAMVEPGIEARVWWQLLQCAVVMDDVMFWGASVAIVSSVA